MAQNSYGLKILGGVFIGFGVIFLFQLAQNVQKKDDKDIGTLIELPALFLLSIIIALRVFHIHFIYIEWIFALAGLALIIVYINKMINSFQSLQQENIFLAILVLIFQLCIVLFTISLIAVPFIPELSVVIGATALILLIGGIVTVFVRRQFLVEGNNISVFTAIGRFKDRSILLLSLFLISSLYLGFTNIGVLPILYSDEYPQAYFELVNKAEAGKEKAVNGRYKHEDFKKMYDDFLSKNISKDMK